MSTYGHFVVQHIFHVEKSLMCRRQATPSRMSSFHSAEAVLVVLFLLSREEKTHPRAGLNLSSHDYKANCSSRMHGEFRSGDCKSS